MIPVQRGSRVTHYLRFSFRTTKQLTNELNRAQCNISHKAFIMYSNFRLKGRNNLEVLCLFIVLKCNDSFLFHRFFSCGHTTACPAFSSQASSSIARSCVSPTQCCFHLLKCADHSMTS